MAFSTRRAAALLVRLAPRRTFVSATRPSLAAVAEKKEGPVVNPDEPEIAPSTIPWKSWKNDYYRKRGFKLAPESWTEWEGLPAPFKYYGVKVDPSHITEKSAVFKFFSDWRTGVPASLLLTMPLWMFNVLPPFDERLELALVTVCAGWVAISAAGPAFRAWKRARVGSKVQALLAAEKELNEEIKTSTDAFTAGSGIVAYIASVNAAERALRGVEAAAATRKLALAQRDSLTEMLNYLVSLQSSGAAESEAAIIAAARTSVEASFEKDAALQARSVDAAIKALVSGSAGEDIVQPLYTAAVAKARSELAAKPAAKPMTNPQAIDIFKKRFGFVEETVSEGTLARAKSDPSALALLTGKVGKTPAVGDKYILRAPISYAK